MKSIIQRKNSSPFRVLVFFLLASAIYPAHAESTRCVLTIQVSQLHWTLDPFEHLKDHVNKILFEIPVDRPYCDQVKVGDSLDNRFRWGSLMIRSSYGQWNVKVVEKRELKSEILTEVPSITPTPRKN